MNDNEYIVLMRNFLNYISIFGKSWNRFTPNTDMQQRKVSSSSNQIFLQKKVYYPLACVHENLNIAKTK